MYTSYIGKRFLEIYNKKFNKELSAKEYFDKEFFPIFYDNERYLQSPANTPLFQLIAQKKTHIDVEREEKKEQIKDKIKTFIDGNELLPEMSFAIGYPSADLLGTTSGQVTSLALPIEEEDIYSSWIGAGFGIGLRGGLNVLIDNVKMLTAVEEGWKLYRMYVNENKYIDNKIETWNSKWITHRFSDNWNADNPRAFFQPLGISKEGNSTIERGSWIEVLFALAKALPDEILTAYVYSLGQMNKTIGFVQIRLPDIKRIGELYRILFEKQTGFSNKKLASIYETQFGFSAACERFSLIGLEAIEPKDLKKYMPSPFEKSFPKLKTDESSIINYTIYQTWMIAMLNNKELLELAEKAAKSLQNFVKDERQTKTKRSNLVENFLSTRSRKNFIESIIPIIKEDDSFYEIGNDLVNRVMLDIAPDNIPLFVTLLRFKYMAK